MSLKGVSESFDGIQYLNHSLGNIISCPNCVETSQFSAESPEPDLSLAKVVYHSGSDTPDRNRAVERTVRAISGGAGRST
jgi:hypothetical protein